MHAKKTLRLLKGYDIQVSVSMLRKSNTFWKIIFFLFESNYFCRNMLLKQRQLLFLKNSDDVTNVVPLTCS